MRQLRILRVFGTVLLCIPAVAFVGNPNPHWQIKSATQYNFPTLKSGRVMKAAVTALEAVDGTKFKHGPISDIIYVAYGSSVDWAYDQVSCDWWRAAVLISDWSRASSTRSGWS